MEPKVSRCAQPIVAAVSYTTSPSTNGFVKSAVGPRPAGAGMKVDEVTVCVPAPVVSMSRNR